MGFVINVNKSQLTPVTRTVYLGFIIDTVSMTLSLPDEKVDKILCACQNLLTCINPSVREGAHVIGLLVSAFPDLITGPLSFLNPKLFKKSDRSTIPNVKRQGILELWCCN